MICHIRGVDGRWQWRRAQHSGDWRWWLEGYGIPLSEAEALRVIANRGWVMKMRAYPGCDKRCASCDTQRNDIEVAERKFERELRHHRTAQFILKYDQKRDSFAVLNILASQDTFSEPDEDFNDWLTILLGYLLGRYAPDSAAGREVLDYLAEKGETLADLKRDLDQITNAMLEDAARLTTTIQ
jgi:hypothetical protein